MMSRAQVFMRRNKAAVAGASVLALGVGFFFWKKHQGGF
jgi:hypothetical protein